MGFLGRVLGIGSKGQIGLKFDKPYYIAGEVVTGNVFVYVNSPIQCDEIVVEAIGKEKVRWEETRQRAVQGRTETYKVKLRKYHEFFKEKIIVSKIEHQHQLMPGDYVYPFQYKLPSDLPGTFRIKKDRHSCDITKLKAEIKYQFMATFGVNGFFAIDLTAYSEVAVYEQLSAAIQPSHDQTKQTVRLCCCIPRGDVSLAVNMDKSVYTVGETAQITAKINNASTETINNMNVKLMRIVRLKADNHQEKIFSVVCEKMYPGVKPGQSSLQAQPLLLVGNDICPSTSGTYIDCSYYIDVECNIPWCPDVHMHLDVKIVQPMITYAGWLPPNVQPMMVPVAVPMPMPGTPGEPMPVSIMGHPPPFHQTAGMAPQPLPSYNVTTRPTAPLLDEDPRCNSVLNFE